jgi:DNA-binding MarR family transcriptional regulator
VIISIPDDQPSEEIEFVSAEAPATYDDPRVRAVLSERVGYLFAKLHHKWSLVSVAVLRDAGLGLAGVHMGALSVIEAIGPISQQELGEYIKKDRTSIVAIVDELEAEGLLERHRNPADRRAYALQPTEKGRDWLRRAVPAFADAEDELLAMLDAGERAVLLDLLQRVLFGEPKPD